MVNVSARSPEDLLLCATQRLALRRGQLLEAIGALVLRWPQITPRGNCATRRPALQRGPPSRSRLGLGSNEADLSLPSLGPYYSTRTLPKSPTTLSGRESTEKLLCVFLGAAAGAQKAGQLLDKNILPGQCCGYCGGVPKISSTAELACIFWCFHGL